MHATVRGVHRPQAADARPPRSALTLAVVVQALISAGDGLGMVALASRVYQGSHAPWAVAAVFLATTVPITALAPLAGLLLDRLAPRPVLVAAAGAQTALAAAMTQVGGTGPTLALAGGFGICAAVLQPGLGSVVPLLAPPDRITKANGHLQAATWGGFTLGPLLAGGLVALGGTGAALAGASALYGLGAVTLRVLPLARPRGTPPPALSPAAAVPGQPAPSRQTGAASAPAPAARPDRFSRQLSAGLRFLRADREAGLLVAVVAIMVAFTNMAVVVEVVFAEQVLNSGPTGYAILVSGWTAGMLGGTLAGGRAPGRRLALVALLGTFAAGSGVALAGVAATLWQAVAAYALGGFANGMETVATRSFLNHRAPPEIAGRVFALYSGVLFGAVSVGMAVAGGLLGSLGPRPVLLVAGSGGIAAGAAGLAIHRRLGRPGPGAPARGDGRTGSARDAAVRARGAARRTRGRPASPASLGGHSASVGAPAVSASEHPAVSASEAAVSGRADAL